MARETNIATGAGLPPTTTASGGAGGEPPRQPRPLKVDAHYPVAQMTYLTISTEDLAGLAFSSGVGSLALSGTIYFHKMSGESETVGLVFCIAIMIAAYVYFGGLVRRIRKRSRLSSWKLFGE